MGAILKLINELLISPTQFAPTPPPPLTHCVEAYHASNRCALGEKIREFCEKLAQSLCEQGVHLVKDVTPLVHCPHTAMYAVSHQAFCLGVEMLLWDACRDAYVSYMVELEGGDYASPLETE